MSALLAAVDQTGNTGEQIVFWVCAATAVFGALGMLISKKAVHSALFVAMTMISLAVLYITLEAPFLGMIQVIVYTGAVMMLFLFVLMVVGVDSSDSLVETIKGQRIAAVLFALGFAGLLIAGIGSTVVSDSAGLTIANIQNGGNVEGIAKLIFGRYVLAFEVTSALLITAALGAMVLAHRERHTPRKTQRQLAEERVLSGAPQNLPGPGVYARHNAVGTPGLLPDGTPTDRTVPEPLRGVSARVGVDHEDTQRVTTLAGGGSAGPVEGPHPIGAEDVRHEEGSEQ
ncbi:MAG: NADH-quinone oxidoreductase subunit J [Actinobacteria bacterium]|nr:NADH-quinone oxidoreductase subunit J [Actinomycetota bacterium]